MKVSPRILVVKEIWAPEPRKRPELLPPPITYFDNPVTGYAMQCLLDGSRYFFSRSRSNPGNLNICMRNLFKVSKRE